MGCGSSRTRELALLSHLEAALLEALSQEKLVELRRTSELHDHILLCESPQSVHLEGPLPELLIDRAPHCLPGQTGYGWSAFARGDRAFQSPTFYQQLLDAATDDRPLTCVEELPHEFNSLLQRIYGREWNVVFVGPRCADAVG